MSTKNAIGGALTALVALFIGVLFLTPAMADSAWADGDYTIRYYSGDVIVHETENVNGDTAGLGDSDFGITKPGCTFAGWYIDANLRTALQASVTASSLATGDDKVVNIYAKWTAKRYTIAFSTDGGSTISNLSNQSVTTSIRIRSTPTKLGYNFDGFYTHAGGTGLQVVSQSTTVGDVCEYINDYDTTTITLYAKWVPLEYTIRCNIDGQISTLPNVFYIDTVIAPYLTDPVKEFALFEGWYFDGFGSGIKIGDFTTLGHLLSSNDGQIVTLYAHWSYGSYANIVAPEEAWTGGTLAFSFAREGDSSATFSHFTGIEVDSVTVDPSNYDAVSGSVVITLHEDYLATLSEGEHTLTSLFDDGISSTTFTTSAAPVAPTIPVTLTLNASKSIDTAGMQFTFPFAAAQPVSGEEGAQVVPRYDSDEDGDIDNEDAFVMIAAKTLTAAAMPGDVQTISDTIALPDASLFGHAGVYAYTVSESQTGKPADWNYSDKSYKIRLYVVNGENGLEYAESPITIEDMDVDTNSDGIGDKVQLLSFANVNITETTITIDNAVTGAYGNHAKAFPFTLTVNLPSWAADDQFEITTTGSNLAGDFETLRSGPGTNVLTTTGGEATITFALAHGQSLAVSGLPVGTTFTTSETDSTDGVNVYVPSASHFYDGADGANDGFTDNTTSYAASLDSNDVPATSLTVFATSEIPNEATMLGVGSGNLVSFSNNLSNPPSPTGIAMAILPYAMMVLVAAGALLVLRNRKRDDDLA